MNEKQVQYAEKAFQFVLRFGYDVSCRIEVDGHRLDVSEVTGRDGPHLLIQHHPNSDEPFRAEARFYPKASNEKIGGRLYLYLLQLDGKLINLPANTALFSGWSPGGIPELVDALAV